MWWWTRILVRREHGLQDCAAQPAKPGSWLRSGESAHRRWLYRDASEVGVDDLCHGLSSRARTPPPQRRLSVDPLRHVYASRSTQTSAVREASPPVGRAVPPVTLLPDSHHGGAPTRPAHSSGRGHYRGWRPAGSQPATAATNGIPDRMITSRRRHRRSVPGTPAPRRHYVLLPGGAPRSLRGTPWRRPPRRAAPGG
jgi:hypothetical protein